MAVAIPIIMAYSGATAALAGSLAVAAGISAGMAATLVTVGTGALLSATGIGGKVNAAASKVFGSDVVSAANIIGAIALASGNVTGAGSVQDAVSGATDAAAGAQAGADVAAGADAAGGVTSAVDAAAGADAAVATTEAAAAGTNTLPSVPIDQSPYANYVGKTAGYTNGEAQAREAAIGQAGAGVKAGGLTELVDKFKALPERTQAALVQAGGSALSGVAGGWSKGQDVANAKAEQIRREGLMQSGSGRQFRYTPRIGALPGGI